MLNTAYEVSQGFPGSSAGKKIHLQCRRPGSITGSGRSPGEQIGYPLQYSWASPGSSDGKESAYNAGRLDSILGLGRSPGEREWPKTWVQSLGWEDILEEELPTPAF